MVRMAMRENHGVDLLRLNSLGAKKREPQDRRPAWIDAPPRRGSYASALSGRVQQVAAPADTTTPRRG